MKDHLQAVITDDDLIEIGTRLLASITTTISLGHNSPAGLADYVERPSSNWQSALVWDYLVSSGTGSEARNATERVRRFVEDNLLDVAAAAAEI